MRFRHFISAQRTPTVFMVKERGITPQPEKLPLRKTHPHSRSTSRAFSLVELLVVIAIMLLLMGLAASSLQSLGRTTEVTSSIQSVADTLNLARQIAISRNAYTQVRFLAPPNTGSDSRKGQYTTLSIYRSDSPYYTNSAGYAQLISEGKMAQESRATSLPESCIVMSDPSASPLWQNLGTNPKHLLSSISMPNGDSDGMAFYFKPNGSMDVPNVGEITSLSICAMQPFIAAGRKLPPNYGIISLDPVTGRYQVIRP